MIFVFGSNLAGRHGKGAALHALRVRGAIYGVGEGIQASHGNMALGSYAIPTKDERLRTLPLEQIQAHVAAFIDYAKRSPRLQFEVTAIGCGLAGYRPEQIAPMFHDAPANCVLPAAFEAVLR